MFSSAIHSCFPHLLRCYADGGDYIVKVSKNRGHGLHELSILESLSATEDVAPHVPVVVGHCSIEGNMLIILQHEGKPLTMQQWSNPEVLILHNNELLCAACSYSTAFGGSCMVAGGCRGVPHHAFGTLKRNCTWRPKTEPFPHVQRQVIAAKPFVTYTSNAWTL